MELQLFQKCTGAKHMSKSTIYKTPHARTLLEVELLNKCCCGAKQKCYFEPKCMRSQNWLPKASKKMTVSEHFWRSGHGFARRNGFCALSKVTQTCGFCRGFKSDGGRGKFKEDVSGWISCGRRSTKDIIIQQACREVRALISYRVCILDYHIFRFAKMTLPDGNRKTHWYLAVSSALNFFFLREALQKCFVLMLSIKNIEKVSQTGFVLKLCIVIFSGKSRRILSFWSCAHPFLFGSLAELFRFRWIDRWTDRQVDR